ncbi:hypothetical protein [Nostoc sp.]
MRLETASTQTKATDPGFQNLNVKPSLELAFRLPRSQSPTGNARL